MPMLYDATWVYIALMLGLWLGATSFFVPGTGLAEVGAVALLGGALWGLFGLSVNIWALALLIFSVAVFILVPLVRPRYTRYAEFALILQAFSSMWLFQSSRVSLWVIGGIIAFSFVYNRWLLVPLMEKMRSAPSVGDEVQALIGAEGRVLNDTPSNGAGTAYINGETWTIRSSEPLEARDIVRVVDVQGLEVLVERIKRKQQPEALANGHVSDEE